MRLIIVHYHLRPGGIRRIIEMATPWLVRGMRRSPDRVTLAVGEAGDADWNARFVEACGPAAADIFVEPAFGYLGEQVGEAEAVAAAVRAGVSRLLAGSDPGDTLIWAHNLGIARNVIFSRELQAGAAARGIPVVAHHHDWWFDNRWQRWPEMRRFGVETVREAAAAVFPVARGLRHVAINHGDARILERHFPGRAGWLPNLTERQAPVTDAERRRASSWLRERLLPARGPVWLVPCRLLRRKNVGEALLLTRWLRPGAVLVVTGGASSGDERPYAETLAAAAERQRWPLRLGLLAGRRVHPPMSHLLAASEALLLTSIQEGFGLPYLEASAAGRPLIARRLPIIAPDLERFGFRFPQYYDEVEVPLDLLDAGRERDRQERMFREWRRGLPQAFRRWVGTPVLLQGDPECRTVPFSRLTLSGQLEVLSVPPEESWKACLPFNPHLRLWRRRALEERLRVSPWPDRAERWLSGPAYAARFENLFGRTGAGATTVGAGLDAQRAFVRERADAAHLFPLLWKENS